MTYPTSGDYVRAVQNPERAFRVRSLQQAKFAVDPILRIPMPASGNAAVVFKAEVDGADHALRFFIRDDVSTKDRYGALGHHFAVRGLNDCVAQAMWIEDAITVKQATWPVLNMQWVEGRTLDAYAGHLAENKDGEALRKLAMSWRAVVDRLQQAEFAHGDLQHGNVLIDTHSALRLVDFDGSWIEAFNGGPPPAETGHPNYQRTGREWGRWMDTFPGLVIYTSLLVLARRPELWGLLHNGENMVFSHDDYAPPFATGTWRAVSEIRDADVEYAAARLRDACSPQWRAAATLEALLRPVVNGADAPTWQPVPVAASAPWWVKSAVENANPAQPIGLPSGPSAPPPPSLVGVTAGSSALPPPPPKISQTVSGPGAPSYQGGRASGWYPPPTQPSAGWPPKPPAPTGSTAPTRPPSSTRSPGRAIVIAIVIGLVVTVFGAVAGIGGFAILVGIFATTVALLLLLRAGDNRGP